ncbi:MAG: hypothetical protein WBA39_29205 [Rivularia sp. (in: cyanobacteria)]
MLRRSHFNLLDIELYYSYRPGGDQTAYDDGKRIIKNISVHFFKDKYLPYL